MGEFSISTTAARMAIGVLRSEGLIYSHTGKGSFVRGQPAVIHRSLGPARKGHDVPSFALDVQAVGAEPTWHSRTKREAATEEIADRLGVDARAPVMVSEYVYRADAEPVLLATSYEPAALVEGTPVEHPEAGPLAGAGVVARMRSIGQNVTAVHEVVAARPPTSEEAETLSVPVGVHVLAIIRTHLAGDMPVETADIVAPGHRYVLEYEVPVRLSKR